MFLDCKHRTAVRHTTEAMSIKTYSPVKGRQSLSNINTVHILSVTEIMFLRITRADDGGNSVLLNNFNSSLGFHINFQKFEKPAVIYTC